MNARRLKVTVAAMMLGLTVVAIPATATAGNPDYCTSGRICVYKNWNFGGGLGWRATSFTIQNLSTAADNQVSSWENRRGTNGRWYKNRNGTGTCYTMSAYRENAKMNVLTQSDTMSSWAGNGAC